MTANPASDDQDAQKTPCNRLELMPKDAHCLQCDYLLRGLSESQCPECGRVFDPADPRTYRIPKLPWWKRRAGPPTWVRVAVTTISALVFADIRTQAVCGPDENEPIFLLFIVAGFSLLILWLITGVDYILRLIATQVWRSQEDAGPSLNGRGALFRWLLVPLMLTLVVACASTGFGVNGPRFLLSRPALEKVVIDAAIGKPMSGRHWVGLFYVEVGPILPDRVLLRTGTSGGYKIGFSCSWPAGVPRMREAYESTRPSWRAVRW